MKKGKASNRFIEQCYRLYEKKMYHVAYLILRDEHMAEDAVSEALLKLMKSNISFADVKSEECKRYMITVIKHSSITIYNKVKRERELIYLTDDDRDFETQEVEEEKHNIDDLVEQLPPKYKEVVECLVQKDLSVKETAQSLDITEPNVRKRFERAKEMLMQLAKGSEEYEGLRQV